MRSPLALPGEPEMRGAGLHHPQAESSDHEVLTPLQGNRLWTAILAGQAPLERPGIKTTVHSLPTGYRMTQFENAYEISYFDPLNLRSMRCSFKEIDFHRGHNPSALEAQISGS